MAKTTKIKIEIEAMDSDTTLVNLLRQLAESIQVRNDDELNQNEIRIHKVNSDTIIKWIS